MKKSSTLNDINIAELVQRLKPHFLSSSLGQPPGASSSATGNRTVAITNRTQQQSNSAPKQVTVKALVAGATTWTFSPAFNQPPVIEVTPVGAPPEPSNNIPAVIYIESVANNAVVIMSTVNTDVRQLHITATGNPN